jgi:protein-disulfide isomerase
MPQLQAYIDSGQVRYVFRNFPLNSIHPQAAKAAEAAECAGELGSYWEMHEALFESQDRWAGNPNAVTTFKSLAKEIGLDSEQFDECLDSGRWAGRVSSDLNEGLARGVQSTPSFFINDVPLVGAQPFEEFQTLIEYYLAGGSSVAEIEPADSYRSLGSPDAEVVITEYSDFQ